MKRVIASLLVASLALAGCDLLNKSNADDPTDPGPVGVGRVAVSPESTVVAVGKTVKLNAYVSDDDGNPMNGKTAEWFTYDASIATVDYAGNVTGVAAGTATITASVDGKRGSSRVRVSAPSTPPAPPAPPPPPPSTGLTITAIGPVPLIEGQSGIINGSGFGNVPSNLWVYVDGVVGKVTATNGTALQFTVPSTGKPARVVDVQVRLLTKYSNTVRVAIKP